MVYVTYLFPSSDQNVVAKIDEGLHGLRPTRMPCARARSASLRWCIEATLGLNSRAPRVRGLLEWTKLPSRRRGIRMYTIENRVGRLIELRVESPVTEEELMQFHDMLARACKSITGQIVMCTDLVGATVFTQPVTQRWTSIIKQDAPIVERNAVLVGEGAVFSMQVARIIRQAGMANRKAFLSPADLVGWLAEILTTRERTRLEFFLRDGSESRARAS